MSKSFFESKKWKTSMNFVYGFGAAIVIVGALFKILHWPGANAMLTIGLLTEAGIFVISAFEPVHMDPDWSLVYPELAGGEPTDKKKSTGSVSQQLDSMLAQAKIGPELIETLKQVDGRWALVSKKTGRPLRYYKGEGKPSDEWVANQERQIQYFKNVG